MKSFDTSEYQKAKEVCREALFEWRDDTNDLFPEDDRSYMIDWTIEDAIFAQNCTNTAIDSILNTCMRNHVSCELDHIRKRFEHAINTKSIIRCQGALRYAHKVFCDILTDLRVISLY